MKSALANAVGGSALMQENAALLAEIDALRSKIVELEQLADTDTLTPLANRRAFLRELERAIRLVGRHETQCALVYMDLDGLKRINDDYGHLAGDAALVHVSNRLVGAFRSTDLAARVAGDEFALILDQASQDDARQRVEAMVARLSDDVVNLGSARVKLKLSWGLTMIRADDTVDSAIGRADAAMYMAKADQRSER